MGDSKDDPPVLAWRGLDHDDDDDPQPDRQCSACGAIAPAAPSSHSLISAKHGWRLQRTTDATGAISVAWFCPSCSAARRARTSEAHSAAAAPVAPPADLAMPLNLRSTGAYEMVSATCKSLMTKIRARATPGPKANHLLRAVAEIENEIATWSEKSGTPERRAEVWAKLRALSRAAEDLISPRR